MVLTLTLFWIPVVVVDICSFREPHHHHHHRAFPPIVSIVPNRRCYHSNYYLRMHSNMDGATIEDIQHATQHKLRVSDSPIKTTTTSSSSSSSKLKKGTMYITVGPQCAGKTTILRKILGTSTSTTPCRRIKNNEDVISSEEVVLSTESSSESLAGIDITIDDQDLVYIPVPTSYFLPVLTSNETTNNDCISSPLPLNQVIFEKSIEERIRDPNNYELTLVIQRLRGDISAEEFSLRVKGGDNVVNDTNISDSKAAQEDLISAVEHSIRLVLQQSGSQGEIIYDHLPTDQIPTKIDLFIVESVFRPRPLYLIQTMPNHNNNNNNNNNTSSSSPPVEALSAIDQAQHLLKKYATNSHIHSPKASISWGNTNTRPREFQHALECAAVSGRPVEFIVFGGMEACSMILRDHDGVSRREYHLKSHGNGEISVDARNDGMHSTLLLCLPKVDRRTLLVRNLQRFLETGRYIPSNAITDAMVQVESMLSQAVAEAKKKKEYYPTTTDEDDSEETTRFCRAKFRLDFELAKLAGYHMKADRTVSPAIELDEYSQNSERNQSRRRYDERNHQQPGRFHGRRSTSGARGGQKKS